MNQKTSLSSGQPVLRQTPTACPGWVRTDVSINALDTHGQPNTTQDPATENDISSYDCAEKTVRAKQHDKDEVKIGKGLSGIAPLMKRLSPSLVAWVNRQAFR